MRAKKLSLEKGFTLIEILVALAIFALVAAGIFLTYGNILEVIQRSRSRAAATTVLNQQIEIIRNLQYDDIGIDGGLPAGLIPYQKTIVREGLAYLVTAYVRAVDDPYDGFVGGSPSDTAPSDYKIVELEVSCPTCAFFSPARYTTWFAPENLEASAPNGSLFINVFDANGQPVADADITVINNQLNPSVTINDTSNSSGTLKLVDVPTSTNGYEIMVSKQSYSSAQTYTPGEPGNPNPIKPHSTVVFQEITEISFAIDRLAGMLLKAQDDKCVGIPAIDINQVGNRLIGMGPDVPLYSNTFTTDSSGLATASGIPWDTYFMTNASSTEYDVVGSNPISPVVVNPGSTTPFAFVLQPASNVALVVRAEDESGKGIAGAAVNLTGGAPPINQTKRTGERYTEETNWTQGLYTLQDGMVDDLVVGQLTIRQILPGVYATNTNSFVISNTIDFGTSTTEFFDILWTASTPTPPGTSLSFQLASNNDNATWIYVGPDGTPGTVYTASPSLIGGPWHDGNRYLRYQVFMNTSNSANTPLLSDIGLNFRSGCTPQSQAFWSGIGTGTYNLTVTHPSYITGTSTVSVGLGWQEETITLTSP